MSDQEFNAKYNAPKTPTTPTGKSATL